MKILHTVESYYPAIGGMQEVVQQLSERLVKLGHEVTVATKKNSGRKENPLNGVNIKEFEIEGNEVRGMKGEVDMYRAFLLNSKFDIVTNFAAQQWATDVALPILDKMQGKKVSVPTGFSGLFLPEYKNYFEKMKTWMKNYDANVFLSDDYRDVNFARENGITKNVLIPNGASADEFLPESKINIREKLAIGKDEFLVLHVGSYTRIKGHIEAIEIYLKSKMKNSTLLFIGHNNHIFKDFSRRNLKLRILKLLHASKNKRIIITNDLTREETVAAYKSADLFLFPSNVECSPIVLFESMASSLPFLTSDCGNSKEILKWSNGGLLLPTTIDEEGYSKVDITKSVTMLNELMDNDEQLKKLGRNGFAAWEKNFTWEHLTVMYENLYKQLLENRLVINV